MGRPFCTCCIKIFSSFVLCFQAQRCIWNNVCNTESWTLILICDFTFSGPWQTIHYYMSFIFLLCKWSTVRISFMTPQSLTFYFSGMCKILLNSMGTEGGKFCTFFFSMPSLFENIIHIIFISGEEKYRKY